MELFRSQAKVIFTVYDTRRGLCLKKITKAETGRTGLLTAAEAYKAIYSDLRQAQKGGHFYSSGFSAEGAFISQSVNTPSSGSIKRIPGRKREKKGKKKKGGSWNGRKLSFNGSC